MTTELRVGLIGDVRGDGPVVILLHGFGAPGDDLVPLAEVVAAPPGTRWVFPEGPLRLDFSGRAWWMIDVEAIQARAARGLEREVTREAPAGLAEARAAILDLIENIEQDFDVASSRIVLVGFSQGGMLALDVMLHAPREFAGVAVLSGTFIAEDDWGPRFPARKGVPVLMSHGTHDPLLPFRHSERLRDALTAAGARVRWVPFEGGHTIPEDVVGELGAFVQEVLGSASGPG
ncbi:MAG: dienelactone hydrolase family protein [Deltaproteobacteria bacterium]|nr:dienelactone hydrolase family protein [Deltaproteobacteria bacterium]